MLDKKHSYTTFGQLLVFVGLLNVIARVNIVLDVIITFLFIAKGGSLIRNKRWFKDKTWNYFLTVFGISYPLVKLVVFYFYFPEIIFNNTGNTISGLQIVFSSSIFLIPMSILSVVAAFRLNQLQKLGEE
ncbi:MAG: hypothetical protein PF574_10615 [Candidatus Delongbacteria bacterium]|jgi:hypothetical protein|nr:hypothetical protein [Candidatus Delongbacteria bacterium]